MAEEHDRPCRDIVDSVLHCVCRGHRVLPQREDLLCEEAGVEAVTREVKRETRQNNQCRCHGEYIIRSRARHFD